MSSFCANILSTKNLKAKRKHRKAEKNYLYKKSCKVVKCWWNWHLAVRFQEVESSGVIPSQLGQDWTYLFNRNFWRKNINIWGHSNNSRHSRGGVGVGTVSPNHTRGREGVIQVSRDIFSKILSHFLYFRLLFWRKKGSFSENQNVTSQRGRGPGGGGVAPVSPNDTWGRGGGKRGKKKCTYCLNGPLLQSLFYRVDSTVNTIIFAKTYTEFKVNRSFRVCHGVEKRFSLTTLNVAWTFKNTSIS